ncbi:MAG TPA: YqiA/YcfP family alpha/beta fold hydrolase, partial [Kofleriaceae bacterium]
MQILYLHGFASGPTSRKAAAFAEHFGKRGIEIERLDLRVPSFEHLRLSAMIDHVRKAIKGPAIVI